MKDIAFYKKIFCRYGGMMRTGELELEKIYYRDIQRLIQEGCVEKVRHGYYQWVDDEDFSEIGTVIRLFPDAVLCMDTALWYYGYSDRTPGRWHLAVRKDSCKSRFSIDYPMDRELFNKAIRNYVLDPGKRITKLMEYAEALRVKKVADDLIGIWL